MKLLHTADWHLGRIFHQVHLTHDQSRTLDGLIAIIEHERPDVVLIAGDVYDRAVPPPEAVELLDKTLSRIAFDLQTPIVMIPGNHDSATRLGFGAKMLRQQGVYIVSNLAEAIAEPIVLLGRDGTSVEIFGLPYVEPAEVRQLLADETLRDHETAMEAVCERIRQRLDPQRRHVLVAHAFVAGARETESERPLSVGLAGTVNAHALRGFDYVALGHLHAPQVITESVVYSGSLQKYSFSECNDVKSVAIIDLPANGPATYRFEPLPIHRDVRSIEGRLQELLAAGPNDPRREDYLHVTLIDDGALLNAMPRLRAVYPNVLHLGRRFLESRTEVSSSVAARRTLSDVDLFRDFCREVLKIEASSADMELFASVVAAPNAEGVPS